MNNKIDIGEREFKEFVFNKIQIAKQLYSSLFFENNGIYRKEDAERFINQHKEYENIIAILHELQVFNWLDVNLHDRNDVNIR